MPRFSVIAWCLLSSAAVAAEPSFTPLPDLPGGETNTSVTALSYDGRVAVGGSGSNLNPLADPLSVYPYRWARDTGIVALSEWPGFANDVSADGSVVVGRYSLANPPRPRVAFRWTEATGPVSLEDLTQSAGSFAYGVSANGMIVAGESAGQAVRWTADGQVMDLGAATTLPVWLSSDGSIASGTRATGLNPDAFRWTAAEGVVLLGQLPGAEDSTVRDMTPDGRVIVGNSGVRGYRWTPEAGMTEFPFAPRALSDDGGIIVGISSIWTEATGAVQIQPFLTGLGLDLTGWTLTSVTAISGDGTTIAGQGIPPDPAMSGAWIATIPEPATWLLLASALASLALCRRLNSA